MGSQIYERPVHELMRDMIGEFRLKKGKIINKTRILNWFIRNYPLIQKSTVNAHITRMSINAPSRVHYKAKPADDLLFQIDKSSYRLYDPDTDPKPIYEKQREVKSVRHDIPEASLTSDILNITNRYQEQWNEARATYTQRIDELEQENGKLRFELSKERTILDEIVDEPLRNRITRLGSAPPDALIREAGVILEDRLRIVGKVDSSQVGVGLVDEIMNPNTGTLIFSTRQGEQEGVRMLYRGAIQFIRNPPMHRLIDIPENTARVYIRLIDSLLQLLTEFQPQELG